MPGRRLLDATIRASGALLGGGVFHAGWLALFLLGTKLDNFLIIRAIWIAAPVVTGTGCAVGASCGARLRHTMLPIRRVVPWTIAGCFIGALAVYWYGPMLIVFAMLGGGTAAVALRELVSSHMPTDPPTS